MSASAAPRHAKAAGFYHCSVKGVGRATGRSVVAAAAYRSGERLTDERTGEVFDYRARGGVVETFIIAPDNAPSWAHDRARLWNEAERAEDRSNGRIANEFVLALPCQLDAASRKEMLKEFLAPLAEKHGVTIDVAIHAPGQGKDPRNLHAHVLVTHREVGADGFGEIANERTIQKKVKVKGHEASQYRSRSIAGIAATPEDVTAIRRRWEQTVNRAYERAGMDIEVDHRSHKDRGLEDEPTKHLGPAAAEMEKRQPGSSDRGKINRDIADRNAALKNAPALEAEVKALSAEIIDLRAERAMREQREAAKGRYDRLDETHSQVARDQFPGRYDELKAATPPPEVVRAFESSANRTAEPAAPVYDRDADNAAWEAKLADAAIAGDAQKPGQQPDDRAGSETSAFANATADRRADGPHAQDTGPLGKTAGEIRMAWTLARTAGELEEALAAKGITLAIVSRDETGQSQRAAAFAKEVGNVAPVLKEGEIVAVNSHGDVYRLNQRTTGDTAAEIEARLNGFAGFDRATLPNVTDAREIMREAARATWRDERQAEREAARPASAIETAIADALASTMTGTEFAAALDAAGLRIARATAADIPALDALRDDETLAAFVARTEEEPHAARRFATLQPGDFAAVNDAGDVFRISPRKLDMEEIEQRLADVQPGLPSVVEARAAAEIAREAKADGRENAAAFWADLRAWNAEAREGDKALHDTVAAGARAVDDTLDAAGDALDTGTRTISGGINRFAKAVENILGGILEFFGGGGPKLSPLQAELLARSNEELAEARAIMAELQDKQAATDWIIFQQDRQQRQEELERETGHRERPGDREREREREWP
jgi:hypothetical protein